MNLYDKILQEIDDEFHYTPLYNFNSMYSRNLHPHEHVKEFISKKVKIEMVSTDEDLYIGQVDGEIIGPLPIEYEAIPDAYEFIRPERSEAEIWFQEKFGKKFTKYCQKLQSSGIEYYDEFSFESY